MCGLHSVDGSPINHHHEERPVFYPAERRPAAPRPPSRRAFLGEVGKGTVAFAILGPAALAACSGDDSGSSASTTTAAAGGDDAAATTVAAEPSGEEPTAEAAELRWARANLGFVSAYVLARGNEAAIVDTGTEGSAEAIGESLGELGLNYSDVGHVVLTHWHGDHAGSIGAVMALATNATAYAGTADLAQINTDEITGVDDGADVFGLEVVATPGHTVGHIAVLDHDASILIAGDALVTTGGGVSGAPEEFSDDVALANASVRTIAGLTFNTLLVGHGDPIEDMASTAVTALAESL